MNQHFTTHFLNMIDEIMSFLENITDVSIFMITYLGTEMSQDQETLTETTRQRYDKGFFNKKDKVINKLRFNLITPLVSEHKLHD